MFQSMLSPKDERGPAWMRLAGSASSAVAASRANFGVMFALMCVLSLSFVGCAGLRPAPRAATAVTSADGALQMPVDAPASNPSKAAVCDDGRSMRVVVDPARAVQVDPTGAASVGSVDAAGNITTVVATVADAVELLHHCRDLGATGVFTILLAPGEHVLRESLEIRSSDGPLEIRSVAGIAVLTGALDLDAQPWRPIAGHALRRVSDEANGAVRTLEISPEALAGWSGGLAGPVHSGHAIEVAAIRSELFLGDVALTPARWPNEGFAEIAEVIDRGSAPREAEADMPAAERRIEKPRAGQFRPFDRARVSRWEHARDAWARGYWNWDWSDEQLPVAGVDAQQGIVRLGMPHRYGLAKRGRFYMTNLLEELDTPGEYWIDIEKRLIYAWLPSDLVGARTSLSLLAQPMISIQGARDVRIENLRFERTRGKAIEAVDVDALSIESCAFRNIGTCAVDAAGERITIGACIFEGIGGRGVHLRGGDRVTLTPSESSITDSRFIGCGRVLRTYNPAIELEGVGHRVLRNEIAWHPHIAVFMRGNDHLIEANDIHHVVLETGDAGAVYCGRDWTSHGHVIRGNLFSAIDGTESRFQNAVYLDDMASGFTVESNLFVECNWGILAGGGRDNVIRDNIFAGCSKALSYDARGVGWMAPHIANPETSTLHKNLAAMPVATEPWSSRFPTLAAYLTDRFGRPVGSSVTGSVLIGTPFGRVDDPACVRVEGTVVIPAERGTIAAMCEEFLATARVGTVELGQARVGPVGPMRADWDGAAE